MNNNKQVEVEQMSLEQLKQLLGRTYMAIGELGTGMAQQQLFALEINRLIQAKQPKQSVENPITLPKLKKLPTQQQANEQSTYEYNGG